MSAARARSRATTSRVGPFPTRSQTTFGGGPSAADSRAKSALRHDRQPAGGGVRPHRSVVRRGQPGGEDLLGPGKFGRQERRQPAGQVLVEQQAHAADPGSWAAA